MTEKDTDKTGDLFENFVDLVAHLRSDEGCEWDRQQTMKSMRANLREEAGEVVEAINSGEEEALAEELGDLLLQVVFLSQIAAEREKFNINDVIERVSAKLRRRHPHVFGDLEVDGTEEILANWERIKEQENSSQTE